MGYKKYLREIVKKEYKGEKDNNYNYKQIYKNRLIEFRKEPAITRIEKPTNLIRARELGYKAKKGVFVVRVRIRKGGGAHIRPSRGRKPKNLGINKLTRAKSIQAIAEVRAAKKFPNAEVLNSYWVGEDGKHKFFEVIMIDVNHPEIKADKQLMMLCTNKQRHRAERGLTSAGKKSRGLLRKGVGAERIRTVSKQRRRNKK
ncbi:MAG: 50S ribosomal protein L15e [Candidatus Diapherotrites archaeon]|nr:50S ribosomal protein L15e [Candidatus Diapherotrites archaeon]